MSQSKKEEWMVLKCPSCAKKLKVQEADLEDREVVCPHCSRAIGSGDSSASLTTGDDLISQANPNMVEEPVATVDTFKEKLRSTEDQDGGASKRKKVRKRKKKSSSHLLNWEDSREQQETDSEEDDPDEWTHTVGMEQSSDGSISEKRRRTTKKKNLTGVEKFAQKLPAVMRGTGAVLVVLIGLVAGVGIWYAFTNDFKPTRAAVEQGPELQLTMDVKAAAVEAIDNFLGQETVEERRSYIRNATTSGPTLEAWSRTYGLPTGKVEKVYKARREMINGKDIILVWAELYPSFEQRFFSVERGADGEMLLDWEVSYNYQEMTFAHFKQVKPTYGVPFRVTLSKSDFYAYEFPEAEYQCYKMTHPVTDISLNGYVKKDSKVFEKFSGILNQGVKINVMVEVRYLSDSPTSDTQVEIVRLLNEDWFL